MCCVSVAVEEAELDMVAVEAARLLANRLFI
jgi:hypothetical protein